MGLNGDMGYTLTGYIGYTATPHFAVVHSQAASEAS